MKEKPVKDITFHYTKPEMAKSLIDFLNLDYNTSVLDAASGKNKVWYNNINVREKYECELEDGFDFFEWNKKTDFIIGNPPYHISWEFTKHAMEIANIGIAWLINNQAMNSHNTPKRIEYMQSKGFYLQKMRVVSDKRWFGRYYFVIYTRQQNDFLTYDRTNY